ncbi:MAG: transglutaminase family protein [Verrucomicrobiota bacterium]
MVREIPENASRVRIEHITRYRYTAPVRFGLHRLVLRPREGHRTTVVSHRLRLQPEADLTWMTDVFGNHIAFAEFLEPSAELVVENEVIIDRLDAASDGGAVSASRPSAVTLPVSYLQSEKAVVDAYTASVYPDETEQVRLWTREILTAQQPATAMDAVRAVNAAIHRNITYRRREEPGVQSPGATLALASGSCRDMATLGMEAVRTLGLAARFVSGYVESSASMAGRGSTHAWMDAYLPDSGWCGFDPTSGQSTGSRHIPLGVSSHPRGVMPVSGTYDGTTGRSLGLTVHIAITSSTPDGLFPAAATLCPA